MHHHIYILNDLSSDYSPVLLSNHRLIFTIAPEQLLINGPIDWKQFTIHIDNKLALTYHLKICILASVLYHAYRADIRISTSILTLSDDTAILSFHTDSLYCHHNLQ